MAKIVLMMTGAIKGAAAEVEKYLETFKVYSKLWLEDKNKKYEEFMLSSPDVDAFGGELARYHNLELEVGLLPPVHNIGCLTLGNNRIKHVLQAEAEAWKNQYGLYLRDQLSVEMSDMVEYVRSFTNKLFS